MVMKKAISLALLVLLITSVAALPQTPSPRTEKAVHDVLRQLCPSDDGKLADVPGLAVVVVKGDKIIFRKGYGMADKEAGQRADVDTMWYIASSTKAFTALAAAMFDAEGKIKFSDPVVRYTTGIQFKQQVPEKITVRDLLTHTSGLRNSALVNRLAFTGQVDEREIDHVFAEGTTFNEENFGKYVYTNLGYNIYGLLLKNTLHRKWQDVLAKRVFRPAGLEHTTAYVSRARAQKRSIAAPYVIDTDAQAGKMIRSVLEKTDENMQSAGGIFMSISDLGRWLQLNMNDGRLDGRQVFPAELMRKVHTGYTRSTRNEPPFSGDGEYGLGWQIGKYAGEKVIYHHGGFSGYRSHVSFMPDKKLAVGVLINNDQVGGRVADMLATYAYDWWLAGGDVEADYTKQLTELGSAYVKRKQEIAAAGAGRSKRAWQLSRPFDDYAGTYKNDLWGTIEISAKDNTLTVRMGNILAVAAPFTDKDTIRVVMLPGGNGEVIGFSWDADGKPVLNYNGVNFIKLDR